MGRDDDDGEDGVVGVGGDAEAPGDGDGSGGAGVEGTEALLELVVGVANGGPRVGHAHRCRQGLEGAVQGVAGVTLFDGLLGTVVPMALVG